MKLAGTSRELERLGCCLLIGGTLAMLGLSCAGGGDSPASDEVQDDPRASAFDCRMIAHTYELAKKAKNSGNPPFGAILVRGDSIVAEATNTYRSTGDVTGHAEISLISDASRRFGREYLSECWLYTSTEPCVMCAGAVRWAGIPRVVYGTPQNLSGWFQEIPCREILEKIAPRTEVIGPVMQEEGRKVRPGLRRRGSASLRGTQCTFDTLVTVGKTCCRPAGSAQYCTARDCVPGLEKRWRSASSGSRYATWNTISDPDPCQNVGPKGL